MSPLAQEMFITQTLPIIATIIIVGAVIVRVLKKQKIALSSLLSVSCLALQRLACPKVQGRV